jgi:phage terminase large subunit-like protein
VTGGRIVAGPYVRAACQRHLDDLKNGHKRGLLWDLDAVKRILEFFPDALRLAGGQFEGVPFELHPSQQFIVASLFGWKQRDGRRRFTRALYRLPPPWLHSSYEWPSGRPAPLWVYTKTKVTVKPTQRVRE